jgi:hypothetical protein
VILTFVDDFQEYNDVLRYIKKGILMEDDVILNVRSEVCHTEDSVMSHIRSDVVSAQFVMFWFTLIVTSAMILSFFRFQSFTTLDESYGLKTLSTTFLRGLGGTSGTVQTGLVIDTFHEFNVVNNKFIFEGILWFKFDPSIISMTTIEGISFENGSIIERSSPHSQIIGDDLFVRYNIRASFQSRMNYGGFPADDHKLYLVLVHKGVSPATFIFDAARQDFLIADDMIRQGWKEYDHTVEAGYIESHISSAAIDVSITNPAVAFGIDYRRNSMRDLMTMLLPMLVMLAIGMCSFALNPKTSWNSRISLTIQTVVGLVAFRFVMESISPHVGYFMISDYLFFLFLCLYILIFLANLAVYKLETWHEKLLIALIALTVVISITLLWIYF